MRRAKHTCAPISCEVNFVCLFVLSVMSAIYLLFFFRSFVCLLLFRAVWEEACGLPNISVPNSFKTAQEYARVSKRGCRTISLHPDMLHTVHAFGPAGGDPDCLI